MRSLASLPKHSTAILWAMATACAVGERGSDERFVGDWQVSGGYGWGLEATSTVSRLHPDGAVEVVFHHEGDYFAGGAAQWRVGETGVSCEFGDSWWSRGDSLLMVESECSDGSSVVATLEFLEPASLNASYPQPVLSEPEDAVPVWEGPMGMFYRCTFAPGGTCDGV